MLNAYARRGLIRALERLELQHESSGASFMLQSEAV
jgi:hypothetical protein